MGSRMAAVAVAVWCVMGEVMAHPVETLRRVGPDEERGEIPAWIVITAIAVVMALAAGGIIFSAVQSTAVRRRLLSQPPAQSDVVCSVSA